MAKKRRLLSCETCRRMKTRCDFDKSKGKCYRCVVLRLDCSLRSTNNGGEDEQGPLPDMTEMRDSSNSSSLLHKISKQLDRIESKDSNFTTSNDGFEELDAPLKVIRQIDHQLFRRGERYDQMREACDEITEWITSRRDYCDKVSSQFEQKCGDFLVQAGIDGVINVKARAVKALELQTVKTNGGSSLTDGPGGSTSLLYAVLVLQGMRCDEQSAHETTQPELFKLIRRAISASLITNPLNLEDIEALLYTARYNAARRPKQPVLDSWLLTSHAITLLLSSVNVKLAIDSATNECYSYEEDYALYVFRLFNELVLCHLQYALSLGKSIHVPWDLIKQSNSITAARGHTINDSITAAEIKLLYTLSTITTKTTAATSPLEAWKVDNTELYSHDKYHQLSIEFHYSNLLLCSQKLKDNFSTTDKTAMAKQTIEHANSIVNCFLSLNADKIEALPNYPLCILVYACMTLCKLVSSSVVNDRHTQISMVTRVYWYLYHIGERPRDIVYTIANIIKSLVEDSNNNDDNNTGVKRAFEEDAPLPPPPPQQDEITVELQNLPDIAQYATYDEFFEEIFNYMNNIDVNYGDL